MDQVADETGRELQRLVCGRSVPEYVKTASAAAVRSPAGLPDSAYADPARRLYPCQSAASTWLSTLFFLDKQAEFAPAERDRIAGRLAEYATFHRIAGDTAALRSAAAARTKQAAAALPDSDYAFVWRNEHGQTERQLPLGTAAEVKEAADWLARYRDRLPYADRQAIAARILTKAAATGAGLGARHDFLERQAGRGIGRPEAIAGLLENRAVLVPAGPQRQLYQKMAAAVRAQPRSVLDPGRLTKLAEMIDQCDRGLGLLKKFGAALPRPEDVIFAEPLTKLAAEVKGLAGSPTGRAYRREDLARVKLADVRDLLGEARASRVQEGLRVSPAKLAAELQGMTRQDAQVIEGLLAEAGVRPALEQAAADRHRLTNAQFARLAAAY